MYLDRRIQNTNRKAQKPSSSKGLVIGTLLVLAAIIIASALYLPHLPRSKSAKSDNSSTSHNSSSSSDPKQQQTASFDKKKYSLTDPTSLWVVINKQRPLNPKAYAPADLVTPSIKVASRNEQVNSQTAQAMETMTAAASKDGAYLMLVSGYRSYATQVATYGSEVRAYGQAQADRESARPDYSEHQSGWTGDMGTASGKCSIQACFADTPEGHWLAKNAYKYGFIIRYPEGKEKITGYIYEPWHVRYVGVELATEMHNQRIQTLEEFFGLPAAPNY